MNVNEIFESGIRLRSRNNRLYIGLYFRTDSDPRIHHPESIEFSTFQEMKVGR